MPTSPAQNELPTRQQIMNLEGFIAANISVASADKNAAKVAIFEEYYDTLQRLIEHATKAAASPRSTAPRTRGLRAKP